MPHTPPVAIASVATWNVNSLRARERPILDWLARAAPDVVALQETMCAPGLIPRAGFRGLGYDVVAHGGDDGRGGVALLSRLAIDDVALGIPGAVGPFAEPRVISATIAGTRVHAVYAPNGVKAGTPAHRFKLAWFELFTVVAEAPDGRAMILGDLNIAPSDADVWEPVRYRHRNLTSPDERRAFSDLQAAGYADPVTPGTFTWWNRRGDFFATDRGWRLDHVLVTRDLAASVVGVTVDRAARADSGSDHAPLVVRFTGR